MSYKEMKFSQEASVQLLLYDWFMVNHLDVVTDWWGNHMHVGPDANRGQGLIIIYDNQPNYSSYAQPLGVYRVVLGIGQWDRLMPFNLHDPKFFDKLSEFIVKYGAGRRIW